MDALTNRIELRALEDAVLLPVLGGVFENGDKHSVLVG